MSGVKGIIGMHRFNICLVVLSSCSGVKTPLVVFISTQYIVSDSCPYIILIRVKAL